MFLVDSLLAPDPAIVCQTYNYVDYRQLSFLQLCIDAKPFELCFRSGA